VGERILRAVPRSPWTWDYTILEEGAPVGRIDTSWFRGRITLTVLGTRYRVIRERALRGAFFLESDGAVLARAATPGTGPPSIAVEHATGWHTVRGISGSGRDFLLLADGREVGAIRSEGRFNRRVRAWLPDDLPLPLGVFFIWRVLRLWKDDDWVMDQSPTHFG
jgi:hypothetical protein